MYVYMYMYIHVHKTLLRSQPGQLSYMYVCIIMCLLIYTCTCIIHLTLCLM